MPWSAGPGDEGAPSCSGMNSSLIMQGAEGSREDVNQMVIQPFLNYNLPAGGYLAGTRVGTADWEASSDDRWTVPQGGGFGKLFAIGTQRMHVNLQAYGNVVKPEVGPDWTLGFTLQFVFPM